METIDSNSLSLGKIWSLLFACTSITTKSPSEVDLVLDIPTILIFKLNSTANWSISLYESDQD